VRAYACARGSGAAGDLRSVPSALPSAVLVHTACSSLSFCDEWCVACFVLLMWVGGCVAGGRLRSRALSQLVYAVLLPAWLDASRVASVAFLLRSARHTLVSELSQWALNTGVKGAKRWRPGGNVSQEPDIAADLNGYIIYTYIIYISILYPSTAPAFAPGRDHGESVATRLAAAVGNAARLAVHMPCTHTDHGRALRSIKPTLGASAPMACRL
jgi:hypothetical protein